MPAPKNALIRKGALLWQNEAGGGARLDFARRTG